MMISAGSHEARDRFLLMWVLANAFRRVPSKLRRLSSWSWSEDHQNLVARRFFREFRYRTADPIAMGDPHRASIVEEYGCVLSNWEFDIPADIYRRAVREAS